MKTVYLRLWIPITVLLLTSLLIIGLLIYQLNLQTNNLQQYKQEEVKHIMIHLQQVTEESIARQQIYFLEQEINLLSLDIGSLALINSQGIIKYTNHPTWKEKTAISVISNINHTLINTLPSAIETTIRLSKKESLIYAYFPVLFPSKSNQLHAPLYGFIYFNYDLKPALDTLYYNALSQGIVLLPSAFMIMLVLMAILNYFINKPINHLVEVMQHFSENKIVQANLTGKGELAILGRTFNQLTIYLLKAENDLSKQKDLYALLTASNQLIIRIKSAQELFDEICKITVEKEHFLLAWVGLVNKQTEGVDVIAEAGEAVSYLDNIFISINPGIPEGQGATAMTIRKNKHHINNNFLQAARNKPWYKIAKDKNIKSSAAFPIVKFGLVIGAFNLYASHENYFTDDIIALLDEMTQDISFALENILLDQLRKQAEITLVEKEKNLSTTLDSIGDGVIVVDNAGLITRINPIAELLTGWNAIDALRRSFDDVFHIINTQSRKKVKTPIYQVLKEKSIVGLANHTTLISKQGKEYQIADSASPIFDENHHVIGAILVFHDVTEQYVTLEALKLSEARFLDVIEASESYIWEINIEGIYTYLTEKAEIIKGHKLANLLIHTPYNFMPPEDVNSTKEIVKQAIDKKGKFELTHRNISSCGHILWEEVKGQVVTNNEGEVIGLRGVGVGINQRKQNEAEIERLAYYDPLTTLPNRRMISNRLADEISAAKRHEHFGALLFIDLDHFKNLNDSLGHEIGDELLIQIAKRLKDQLRKEDIAARLGGDEFIVLLTHLSLNMDIAAGKVRKVTEKLLRELRKPYQLKQHKYYNGSSIGITLFPVKNENAETIFKQADTALYRAKDKGRNNFQFYHPQMQEMANKRLELEKDLRIALLEEQLELYYQPQINQHGKLRGAEVLLRWNHPTKGYISPDQFIPVAEDAGLIIEIGDWIFRQGFYQIRLWEQRKLLRIGQHISINVSPKQFKEEHFAHKLIQMVNRSEVNPNLVILEVTEGIFLEDIEDTVKKMEHLKSLGFVFSIDDFGTGYSSLSYLKRLPIYELKIDKAFIDDLENDKDDQVIIDTIIAMAKHLKLTVIAEGVETLQQFEILKAHGCFNYQGYFFSQALEVKAFEIYMKKHK